MNYVARPNSFVARATDSTTTLRYGLQVNPSPLTVSLSKQVPSYASLEFVITNPSTDTAVQVMEIDFQFPVGDTAADLTYTTKGSRGQPSDTNVWSVQLPPQTTSGTAKYTLRPAVGKFATIAAGGSVVVQLYEIPANLDPGTSVVAVKETLQSGGGATSFAVTTFPYGFYFNGLTATTLSGSTYDPVAQVPLNGTVTLTWNSSIVDAGAFRIMYSDPVNGEQHVTPLTAGLWTSGPLTADTVFTLVVQTTVTGGAPLTASMSVAVAVRNPVLVATSVSTSGPINAQGTVTGVGICPPGTVIMFSGDIDNINNFSGTGAGVTGSPYEGWQVCNGQNGAPDLRNRFIVGAGDHYKVGDTGGADSVTLSLSQIPSHSHGGETGGSAPYLNYQGVYYESQGVSSGIMFNNGVNDPNGNRPNLLTTMGLSEIQVLNHPHVINPDGGGQAHENRPQFWALAYLIRM